MRRLSPERRKRRTTLTLPMDALRQAEQIARDRRVNLSSVVSEVIAEGLRTHTAAARSGQIMNSYRRAFTGLTPEETMILDGIVLAPSASRKR